jgi:hypothetical protein
MRHFESDPAIKKTRLPVWSSGGRIVLGYLLDNGDGSWCIELKGKVVEVVYGSLRCAAKAIHLLNPVLN